MTEIEKLQSALALPDGYAWHEDSPYFRQDRWMLAAIESPMPEGATHPVVGTFYVKAVSHPASDPLPDPHAPEHQARLADTIKHMRDHRKRHPKA